MAKARKFQPGNTIGDIYELIALLRIGCWVYWRGRPKHPSFLLSMQLNALIHPTSAGQFSLAVPVEQPAGKAEQHREAA